MILLSRTLTNFAEDWLRSPPGIAKTISSPLEVFESYQSTFVLNRVNSESLKKWHLGAILMITPKHLQRKYRHHYRLTQRDSWTCLCLQLALFGFRSDRLSVWWSWILQGFIMPEAKTAALVLGHIFLLAAWLALHTLVTDFGFSLLWTSFETAPQVSVNFVSLVSHLMCQASGGGATNSLSPVLYMGISLSR